MNQPRRPLAILRLLLSIRETSAPYNQFSLAWSDMYDITIGTFFKSDISPPKEIPLFEGDGSISGFIHVLKEALDAEEYDVIHAHSPHIGLLYLATTRFVHRESRSCSVVTIHDSYPNYKLRNRLMLLPVFAGFQRIVCCSQASFDSFPSLYKRLAGDRLTVVQNGLDIGHVDRIVANTSQRAQQTSDFSVIAISRLVDIKNPFSAITAFRQSTDQSSQTSRLVYIGDGPLRDSLVSASGSAGSEGRIEFTGLIPREEVFEHLVNADLYVSTSRGEGLPISVMEAMACRCPVLLSDIPPHREIAEGVDFIPLIHPDDTAGFAQKIKQYREMPVAERKAIGQKCRRLVEQRFSLHAMHSGYADIYAQITADQVPSTLHQALQD